MMKRTTVAVRVPRIPLSSLREDWGTVLVVCVAGLLVAFCESGGGPRWLSWAFASVVATTIGYLVAQVCGRWLLNKSTRYVTADGLRVVSNVPHESMPDERYVEQICRDTLEWMIDNDMVDDKVVVEKLRGGDPLGPWLDGCVLEIVDEPLPEHCSLVCPWPILAWDDTSWMKCGVNTKDRRIPAAPHVLFHLVMAKVFDIRSDSEVHEMVDDHGFDVAG